MSGSKLAIALLAGMTASETGEPVNQQIVIAEYIANNTGTSNSVAYHVQKALAQLDQESQTASGEPPPEEDFPSDKTYPSNEVLRAQREGDSQPATGSTEVVPPPNAESDDSVSIEATARSFWEWVVNTAWDRKIEIGIGLGTIFAGWYALRRRRQRLQQGYRDAMLLNEQVVHGRGMLQGVPIEEHPLGDLDDFTSDVFARAYAYQHRQGGTMLHFQQNEVETVEHQLRRAFHSKASAGLARSAMMATIESAQVLTAPYIVTASLNAANVKQPTVTSFPERLLDTVLKERDKWPSEEAFLLAFAAGDTPFPPDKAAEKAIIEVLDFDKNRHGKDENDRVFVWCREDGLLSASELSGESHARKTTIEHMARSAVLDELHPSLTTQQRRHVATQLYDLGVGIEEMMHLFNPAWQAGGVARLKADAYDNVDDSPALRELYLILGLSANPNEVQRIVTNFYSTYNGEEYGLGAEAPSIDLDALDPPLRAELVARTAAWEEDSTVNWHIFRLAETLRTVEGSTVKHFSELKMQDLREQDTLVLAGKQWTVEKALDISTADIVAERLVHSKLPEMRTLLETAHANTLYTLRCGDETINITDAELICAQCEDEMHFVGWGNHRIVGNGAIRLPRNKNGQDIANLRGDELNDAGRKDNLAALVSIAGIITADYNSGANIFLERNILKYARLEHAAWRERERSRDPQTTYLQVPFDEEDARAQGEQEWLDPLNQAKSIKNVHMAMRLVLLPKSGEQPVYQELDASLLPEMIRVAQAEGNDVLALLLEHAKRENITPVRRALQPGESILERGERSDYLWFDLPRSSSGAKSVQPSIVTATQGNDGADALEQILPGVASVVQNQPNPISQSAREVDSGRDQLSHIAGLSREQVWYLLSRSSTLQRHLSGDALAL